MSQPMRIIIEIDGKQVLATDVTSGTPAYPTEASHPAVPGDPPPELLRAARERGAQSAGPAAFASSGGAMHAAALSGALPVLARRAADIDAGGAPAEVGGKAGKKGRTRRGKR